MARTAKDTFTNDLCEKPVGKRISHYDTRVSGLYVSVSPKGTASFIYKFWNKEERKQQAVKVGSYVRGKFGVEEARRAVMDMQVHSKVTGKLPTATHAAATAGSGMSFHKLVSAYIDYISRPDPLDRQAVAAGRPRVESWRQSEAFFKRPKDEWGHLRASAITTKMVADLLKTLGHTEGHPVYMNAVRIKLSTMFDWAMGSDREYLTANPCNSLGKDYFFRGDAKDRVLDANEIRTLWHGLEDPNCPGDHMSKLALKLILTTMMRPNEVASIEVKKIADGMITVPVEKVKNRSGDFSQPMSTLACEIVNAALGDDVGRKYLFPSGTSHIQRGSVSTLLSRRSTDATGRAGIIEFLGMKPFTPHDLRRTAATLAGELGISEKTVAKCLNHTMVYNSKEEQAPAVTTRVYIQSKHIIRKETHVDPRIEALEKVAHALREIVGLKPVAALQAPQRRLTAA